MPALITGLNRGAKSVVIKTAQPLYGRLSALAVKNPSMGRTCDTKPRAVAAPPTQTIMET